QGETSRGMATLRHFGIRVFAGCHRFARLVLKNRATNPSISFRPAPCPSLCCRRRRRPALPTTWSRDRPVRSASPSPCSPSPGPPESHAEIASVGPSLQSAARRASACQDREDSFPCLPVLGTCPCPRRRDTDRWRPAFRGDRTGAIALAAESP